MTNFNTLAIYSRILTPEKVGTVVNYRGIFITLAHGDKLKYCGNLQQYLQHQKM
jgi:hypothetical protein